MTQEEIPITSISISKAETEIKNTISKYGLTPRKTSIREEIISNFIIHYKKIHPETPTPIPFHIDTQAHLDPNIDNYTDLEQFLNTKLSVPLNRIPTSPFTKVATHAIKNFTKEPSND